MNNWSDRLIAAGAFCLAFGAYLLFLKGPAANQKQLVFRVCVVAAGIGLGVFGFVMKSSTGGRRG